MCKAEQLIGRLSPAERRALRLMDELDETPNRRAIPLRHEVRLIDLGLAELACGALGLTAAGRRAVALIGGWEA